MWSGFPNGRSRGPSTFLVAGRRSLFGPGGIVPGTERRERWLLWPTGIASPGAMRQWGNHATTFFGCRHFDDPYLLEQLFTPASPAGQYEEPTGSQPGRVSTLTRPSTHDCSFFSLPFCQHYSFIKTIYD
jgi:hypothetical protein